MHDKFIYQDRFNWCIAFAVFAKILLKYKSFDPEMNLYIKKGYFTKRECF